MDNQSIKKNIEFLRMSAGLSQTEVAHQLEISRVAFRNIEKGETKIVNEILFKLAEILGVSPEHILLGYEPGASDSVLEERNSRLMNQMESMVSDYEQRLDELRQKYADLLEFNRNQSDYIKLLIQSNSQR